MRISWDKVYNTGNTAMQIKPLRRLRAELACSAPQGKQIKTCYLKIRIVEDSTNIALKNADTGAVLHADYIRATVATPTSYPAARINTFANESELKY
jgi:hypothetical protein